MAKKVKTNSKLSSYVFLGLMLATAVVGLVGLLISTHYIITLDKTTTYTLGGLAEYFANANKLTETLSTTALTCTQIFGWIAVAGAIVLVVLEALNLFGVKVPSIVKWIFVVVTLVSAVAFIVCSATVCVDFYGGKEAYDNAVKTAQATKLTKNTVLSLGAGSYMTVIGTALVPMFAVAKKLTTK